MSRAFVIAVACAVLFAGCTATNPAPRKYRHSETGVARSPYGSWVVITTRRGPRFSGELIAVDDRHLFVELDGARSAIPAASARKVVVYYYNADNGEGIGWGILGTLSTISHGFFLIFSAPTWMISSAVAANMHSAEGHLELV